MAVIEQTVFIPIRFPGLNDYSTAERKNRHIGGKMKKEYTDAVTLFVKDKLQPLTVPFTIAFHWYEKDARRDPDNIVFAKKFIMDGLKQAKVIPDDSQKWVKGFDYETWTVDKGKQGVEITIRSIE